MEAAAVNKIKHNSNSIIGTTVVSSKQAAASASDFSLVALKGVGTISSSAADAVDADSVDIQFATVEPPSDAPTF